MTELLLARGGGRGLIEETFLFGTESGDDERDGDKPNDGLVVDLKLSNTSILFRGGWVLK